MSKKRKRRLFAFNGQSFIIFIHNSKFVKVGFLKYGSNRVRLPRWIKLPKNIQSWFTFWCPLSPQLWFMLGNLFQYPLQCILVEMSWTYMCINKTVNSIQLLLFCGQNDDLIEKKQQLLFYYMIQLWVDTDISNILSVNFSSEDFGRYWTNWEQIEKRNISFDDLFLVQCKENQCYYWPLLDHVQVNT